MSHPTQKITLQALRRLLDEYSEDVGNFDLRTNIGRCVELHALIRGLALQACREAGLSTTSARARLRGFFELYPNKVLSGQELAVVSGISEYARRIRELRDDEGMDIVTGPGNCSYLPIHLKADQYLFRPS